MICTDARIKELVKQHEMISPFSAELIRQEDGRRIFSAGLSSVGYDIRLDPREFKVFSPIHGGEIDPKRFDEDCLVQTPLKTADDGSLFYLMPPHTYALGITVEYFRLPPTISALCIAKSSMARSGLLVNTTLAEPAWEGRLVVELANLADLPLRVYVNEGLGQMLFFEHERPEIDYASKARGGGAGRYMNQEKLTLPSV